MLASDEFSRSGNFGVRAAWLGVSGGCGLSRDNEVVEDEDKKKLKTDYVGLICTSEIVSILYTQLAVVK